MNYPSKEMPNIGAKRLKNPITHQKQAKITPICVRIRQRARKWHCQSFGKLR
jgi:hypothetical protein